MNGDQPISRKYHSRRREEQAANTRAEIARAARQLFVEHGYTQTTISEIANEAGVSTQTIYNSIGGKAALLLAVVESVDQISAVGDVLERIRVSEDPGEVIDAVMAMRCRTMAGAADILRVFLAAALAEPEIEAAQQERTNRTRRRCRQIAVRLHDLDALRDGVDVEMAQDVLYTLLHHTIWQRLSEECGWELERVESWLRELLRRELLGQRDEL